MCAVQSSTPKLSGFGVFVLCSNFAGQLYGNVITHDSTQAKSLSGIIYADVKANKVEYIANGQAPDSTTTILISVSQHDQPEITGSGQLVIKPGLDHFAVTVSPDTVAHADTTVITVQAQNVDNNDIAIPDTTLIAFSLDANGETYGDFLAPDGSQADSLAGIQYGDAKAGMVKFVANGENPIESDPKMFTVTAALKSDASRSGLDTAWVKCKTYNFVRYAQGDSQWASHRYDSYIKNITGTDTTYYTIGAKGCALSSMSMTLQAHGVNNNPDLLNTWMTNNSGFDDAAVIWDALSDFPNNTKVEYKTGFGQGLQGGVTVPLSKIDSYLQKCFILVVQVKNPDTNRNHWVVIKEKKNGNYHIVDPGRDRTLLSEYSNNVYKVRIFVKK